MSQVGDWMETTTTAWLLYDITRSPVLLGLGGGIRALSILLFGLIGGAVADRVNRRQMLFLTQSLFALSSLILGILIATGNIAVWHIYVFTAFNGALGSFDAPARRSLFPMLVPRTEMQNAVLLNSSVFRLARLIGPGIAGVILAAYGPAVSYFVNVASYSAILVAVRLMREQEMPTRVRGSLLADALDGLRYSMSRPLVRSVLVLESVHSLFGVNTALLTIFASDVLHAGPEGLGLLLSSLAAGGLIGTAGLVVSGDVRQKGRTMMISGIAYGLALAMLAFVDRFVLVAIVVAALGVLDAFWTTMRNTILQLQTEESYRGRTMGVVLLAGRGFGQGSQLETGLAVSAGGPAFAVLFGATIIGASLVAMNAITGEVRRFRGTPEPLVTAIAVAPDPSD